MSGVCGGSLATGGSKETAPSGRVGSLPASQASQPARWQRQQAGTVHTPGRGAKAAPAAAGHPGGGWNMGKAPGPSEPPGKGVGTSGGSEDAVCGGGVGRGGVEGC